MSLINTQAHRAARNAATIALADAGPGNSSIKLYTAQGGTLLGTRTLAKPCGSVRPSDGRIVLATAETADVVMATGAATWATWCDGAGQAISAGRVTDTAGNITDGSGNVVPHPDGMGTFVLGGTTGTNLYLGGLVLLYAALLG